MVVQSQTKIKIGNKEIADYKSLRVNQEIDSHHTLELIVRLRNLEKEALEFAFESKKYLGKKINVKINTLSLLEVGQGFEFNGVITQIKNVKGSSDYSKDEIIFIAKSPTVLIDDGPHYTSFSDMSLTELVDKTLLPYGDSKINFELSPMDDQYIQYAVQSGESTFNFLRRIAAQYGEWLYYDGTKLIFGKPETTEVKLKRDFDLRSYDLTLNPLSDNYKYFSPYYQGASTVEGSSSDASSSATGYSEFVSERAKELFDRETAVWHNSGTEADIQKTLDRKIKKQKEAIRANSVRLNAISENPAVKLGSIVVVSGLRYRVIKISHYDTKDGIYENRFEALPNDNEAYPKTDIDAHPQSQSQCAVVLDNNDPEGLGRIVAQFPWQNATGERTPWMRIVSPHGGADKGFQFIPEIGEEILVGFEGGNAERPYMLGSMYNGKANANSWQTANNDIKAIRTRSGHTIELNDASGAESITIFDTNGNKIHIDTAGNNITIQAVENMTFSANNISINANENITLTAGNDLTQSVAENYNLMAKNNNNIVEENIVSDSKKNEILSDEVLISSAKEDLVLNSGKSVDVQSKEKVKLY